MNLQLTNPETSEGKKKIAMITIGTSVVALILGIISRTPIFDTISLGGWIGFISFLCSLGSVENTGSNFYAKTAFWISFVSMTAAIFLSATV